jgi:hypothetical protein
MVWTPPKTWTSEPLTSVDLNRELRDNLDFLKNPPTAHYTPDETNDYTTINNQFHQVDSNNLSLQLTTYGGALMVGFYGVFSLNYASSSARVQVDIEVNGVRQGGSDGLAGIHLPVNANHNFTLSFVRLVTGLSSGQLHTVNLVWRRRGGGTATLFAGAGTSETDYKPQFWAREVS